MAAEDETGCKCGLQPHLPDCFHIPNCYYNLLQPFVMLISPLRKVPLHNFTRCSAVSVAAEPYCVGYIDQTNCTDETKVAMSCLVTGYETSIASTMVCSKKPRTPICDDGLDQLCVETSLLCHIHKHQVCDLTPDCEDWSDEIGAVCGIMTKSTCARRFNPDRKLPLPISWLRDGQVDCFGGEDEDRDEGWPVCGQGRTERYVPQNDACNEVFFCPEGGIVEMQTMCDGRSKPCARELEICDAAKPSQDPLTSVRRQRDTIYLTYCGIPLREIPDCRMVRPDFGVDLLGANITVSRPVMESDCSYLFGRSYVYMSCSGGCKDQEVCPVGDVVRHTSCPDQYPDRVYTLATRGNLSFLSFLIARHSQTHAEFFQCDNGQCVDFGQVCDLVDDCGDGSDEASCSNHVRCAHVRVPHVHVCDGVVHCPDLSDECNDRCGAEILPGLRYKGICWVTGVSAVVLNSAVISGHVSNLGKIKSPLALSNKVLLTAVAVGDFLMGAYLTALGTFDAFIYGNDYCKNQYRWISSTYCSALGFISTFGSHLSLFSMTVLSLTRFMGVKRSLDYKKRVIRKSDLIRIAVILSCITACSVSIAGFPFIGTFINGVTYDTNIRLFSGVVDRQMHLQVLSAYYGRVHTSSMGWETIFSMIREMFSEDYGTLDYRIVGFYGNDRVCLFKYFVDKEDKQKHFVWCILALNFICFLIIGCSYSMINAFTKRLQVKTTGSLQKKIMKRNRVMQRKIFLIIATDFVCWVPFVVLCALHSLEVLDATSWYMPSSIVILPVNAVVNPLLYDNMLVQKLTANKNVIALKGMVRAVVTDLNTARSAITASTAHVTTPRCAIQSSEHRCTIKSVVTDLKTARSASTADTTTPRCCTQSSGRTDMKGDVVQVARQVHYTGKPFDSCMKGRELPDHRRIIF